MYIYYKWPNNLNFTHLKVTLHFAYVFLQLRGRERERERKGERVRREERERIHRFLLV